MISKVCISHAAKRPKNIYITLKNSKQIYIFKPRSSQLISGTSLVTRDPSKYCIEEAAYNEKVSLLSFR